MKSELTGSMWLDWVVFYDQYEQLVGETIDIYKVRTAKLVNGKTVLGHIDQGSVSIDYTRFLEDIEEGSGDPSSVILFSGFSSNILSGIKSLGDWNFIREESTYKKILEIMYGGDCSVLTDEDRIRDLKKYLKSCGFEPRRGVV